MDKIDEMFKTAENQAIINRVEGIIGWFDSHPGAKDFDPNAYEFVSFMIDINNIKNSLRGTVPSKLEERVKEFWENRKNNFSKNGLSTDSMAFKICSECYDGELSKKVIGKAGQALFARLAGISLYTDQVRKRRNPDVIVYDGIERYPDYVFDNRTEIEEIKNNLKISTKEDKENEYMISYVQDTLNEILVPKLVKKQDPVQKTDNISKTR